MSKRKDSKKLLSRIVTFLYHEVTDDASSSGFQGKSAMAYKHGTREFKLNLDIISESSVMPSLFNEIDFNLPDRYVMMTFDDGGISAMHIADEIEKRGWKGHFFITTGMIDYRKFLTKKDIAELDARGHVIGSHSHTHPDIFYNLSREKMLEEWKVSCDILSELIQKPVVTASVPGGDMNLLTQMTAKSAGIKYLFTSEPIATPWEDDGLICIGRFCLKKDSPPDLVRDFAQFRGFFRQKFIRMTKQSVKRAIAPYYQWKMSSNKMQSS